MAVTLCCSKDEAGNPIEFCAPVVPSHAPSRGGTAAEAWVTMIEFADFQCPYCAKVQTTMTALLNSYGSELRLVFLNAPLEMHAHANAAARAGYCVHTQEPLDATPNDPAPLFWAMHDLMFDNQDALTDSDLRSYASTVGVNVAAWDLCMEADSTAAAIADDIDIAVMAGLTGTPMFLVNGKPIHGAQAESEFRAVIDEQLAAAKASGMGQEAYYAKLAGEICN